MSSEADRAELVVQLPNGFSSGELAPPDFSQSPRLSLEQWRSARGPDGHLALAWGCVAGDARSWSPDATELAQGKLAELASGTAARLRDAPSPMHVVSASADGLARELRADAGEGHARTFVAFTPGGAHGCFVSCTAPECESAVAGAHLSGTLVAAPPPGLALRSLAFAVHHPHGALAALAAVLALAAAAAIATRPRPRAKR